MTKSAITWLPTDKRENKIVASASELALQKPRFGISNWQNSFKKKKKKKREKPYTKALSFVSRFFDRRAILRDVTAPKVSWLFRGGKLARQQVPLHFSGKRWQPAKSGYRRIRRVGVVSYWQTWSWACHRCRQGSTDVPLIYNLLTSILTICYRFTTVTLFCNAGVARIGVVLLR